jgi:two-component system, NarL family, invasion response regulator UvrY
MGACHCLLVDDHPIVRRGVRDLLDHEQLCSVIEEVSSGVAALEAIRRKPWGLMLLDVALPDKHGLEVLKEAKEIQPKLPVLMLSLYPEKEFAMRAIKAGASGYLTKQSAPAELVAAVSRVLQGGRYITEALAEQMAEALGSGAEGALHARLSDRELQVLRLFGKGKSVSVIAEELCLSVKTVSTYRARILEKLSCQSTGELIRYAIEAHLID